jgi:predicted ATP-binding protein involved in virulence
MRIDHLSVRNFKGFTERTFDLDPSFNVFIGPNGSGKSSLLDAIAVASGSWLLGIPGYEPRHMRQDDVRLLPIEYDSDTRFERQYPVEIEATGYVIGEVVRWSRSLNGPRNRTTTSSANAIKSLASKSAIAARAGSEECVLPLISYYGTSRLWQEPRQTSLVKVSDRIVDQQRLSRLDGYRNSIDPRLSTHDLIQWIARQEWIEYQQGRALNVYRAVRSAILGCIEGARRLYFDASRGEVIVDINEQGLQPFANLSDGQRAMLALVGDLAQKAVILNPQLDDRALAETPGIVLVDEIELHLHPSWQRRVIGDLKRTFPAMQFICTTHSPQVIGQARRNEITRLQTGDFPLHPIAAYGLSSDEILETVQAATNRDGDINVLVANAMDYLSELDVDGAENAIARLRLAMETPSAIITDLETRLGNVRAILADDADAA